MRMIPCDKCQKQILESDSIYKSGKNFCSVACSLGTEDTLKNISWSPKEQNKELPAGGSPEVSLGWIFVVFAAAIGFFYWIVGTSSGNDLVRFFAGVSYQMSYDKNAAETQPSAPAYTPPKDSFPAGPHIEVQSWKMEANDNYISAIGEVKNISGQPLEFVQVIFNMYDASGNIIDTNDAYLADDRSLADGRLSTFKVNMPWKSEMKNGKGEISFKEGRHGHSLDFVNK